MSKINIGIVGTGGMAKIHTTAYMRNQDAYVYGVCSALGEHSEQFASGEWETVAYSEGEMGIQSLYKIEHVYDTYQDMAKDPKIHAISIAVPNILHYEIAMEMIRYKKHVLVEKPMAINSELAGKLVAAAKENGVILATGHMWRYHKEVQYLKKIIEDGGLGDIVQTKSYGLHLQWGPGGWFSQKSQSGGGALIDMGVHAIDTTRYLLNDPAVKSVYASVGTKFGDYDVDDYAQIMVKHENGIVSLFESGWNFPYINGVEASTEIWGTRGYARLFPTSLSIKIGEDWGTFTPKTIEKHTSTEPYNRQVNNFVAAIKGTEDCLVAYEVGFNVLKICDAAYESAEKDIVVRF